MAIAANSYAAKKEDITLIVTSDGITKDEAIKNALRSAIEQTYGVFVSTNTELLDDEIIKDDIATVSSGNIKHYKELSLTNYNDNVSVTLEVVVSKGKLLNYAKSKGAKCELDGNSMYADIQLQELYARNEEKMFENLCMEVEQLLKDGYD